MPHPQLTLGIEADLLPRGDGTYVLRPKLPSSNGTTWVGIGRATQILGCSPQTVYRLAESGHLRSRRIARRRITFEIESLLTHARRCEDPEFWASQRPNESSSATAEKRGGS